MSVVMGVRRDLFWTFGDLGPRIQATWVILGTHTLIFLTVTDTEVSTVLNCSRRFMGMIPCR